MVDSITTIYAYLNRVCWIRNESIRIEEEHKRILSIGSQYTLEGVCLEQHLMDHLVHYILSGTCTLTISVL